MLKHIGQYFEHEGIRVVDHIAVLGFFPEADISYNTEGRFGDIRKRPDEHDLAEVADGRRQVVGHQREIPLAEGDAVDGAGVEIQQALVVVDAAHNARQTADGGEWRIVRMHSQLDAR